jgi:Xaa-Pro aminopeptidase
MSSVRREKLRKKLAGDWAFFIDQESIYYLTNFSGSNGTLIISPEAENDVLLTDARYRERVKKLDQSLNVVIDTDLGKFLRGVITKSKRILFDGDSVSAAKAQQLREILTDVDVLQTKNLLTDLRITKDASEITEIKKACEITSQSLWYLINDLRPNMSERQIAKKFWQNALDRGADDLAFSTIVASGENSASPHHEPTSRVLKKGDAVTIDCGVRLNGYNSDMTRTVFIGETQNWQVEIYEVVMQAQAKAVAESAVGKTASEVDALARDFIAAAGFGEYFVHGTGHGVGLQVHEAPILTKSNHTKIEENFCFTIEPGIYLPGRGGVRIEDTCILDASGLQILTQGSHEIVCVS